MALDLIFYLKSNKIINMKRLFVSLICLELLILGAFLPLGALEIELSGGANNMTFKPDRITAYSDGEKFEGNPFLYGDLSLKGVISENLKNEWHLQRDNILLNSLSGKISTNMDYFNVGFGPLIGIGDKAERPYLGFTGEIELAYPGIVFFSINGDATLFSELDFTGDSSRESGEAKLGFWLPGLIVDFSVSTKSLTRQYNDSTILRDALTRFQFSADFFVKNAPLGLRIDTGYEILSRTYRSGTVETTDELNAVFIGFEAKVQASRQLRIIGGFEMPFHTQTTSPMGTPDDFASLYKFKAGAAYTFF